MVHTSLPWIQTWPLFGRSRPTRCLRSTDLPVPEGPSSTEISPGGIVRLTSSQIRLLPKRLVRFSTLTSAPTAVLPRQHFSDHCGRPPSGLSPDPQCDRGHLTNEHRVHR